MHFLDRAEAGRVLVRALEHLRGQRDLIVLALPRGGVPVAYEIARALAVPLDVFVVRKLGVPGQEELAMGCSSVPSASRNEPVAERAISAVASGGVRVLNEEVVEALGERAPAAIEEATRRETEELRRREERYRGAHAFPDLAGKTVLLVDDGLATGATMRAAARAVRQRQPARLIVAVPVAAQSTCREMETEADEVICALIPETFFGVGQFYENFDQTSDEEVRTLLTGAASEREIKPPNEKNFPISL